MTKQELKQQNDALIYENTTRDITGQIMHDHLEDIIDNVAYPDDVVTVTASNGLTEDNSDIKLGGDLTQHTEINGTDNFGLSFANLSAWDVTVINGVEYSNIDMSDQLILTVSDGTNISSINLTSLDLTITDEINNKGIIYANDYSTNFTDRSLVDKAYVDNTISDNNEQFIKLTGTDVGKPVTGTITFLDYTGKIINVVSGVDNNFSTYINADDGNFDITTEDTNEEYKKGLAFGGDNTLTISVYGTNPVFQGLTYNDDYSANFTDRSLVDKAYVDTLITNSTWQSVVTQQLTNDGWIYVETGSAYFEDDGGQLAIHSLSEKDLSIGTNNMRFEFNNSSTTTRFRDTRDTPLGIEYEADYSANFTNRSLVDKAYVDSKVSTSIFDDDMDTGIAVEQTADDDTVRVYSQSQELINATNNTYKRIKFCDYEEDNNGTYLDINDDGSIIRFNGYRAEFGDIEGNGNETYLLVDDTARKAIVNGSVSVIQNGANTGEFLMREDVSNGANYVGFKAPSAISSDQVWTLPSVDGDENSVLSTNGSGILGWRDEFNTKKFSAITSDTTLVIDNINNTTEVIMVDATAGDVTVTLPLKTDIANDGRIHQFRIAKKDTSDNKVIIKTSGTETFPQSITELVLLYAGETATLGGSYDNGWFWLGQMKIVTKVDRENAWDASNFSSLTAIPFENLLIDDNPDIFSWDSGDPTKITSHIKNRVTLSYSVDIDSTGGSTYNVETYVYKNGVEVKGSKMRTGNYGGEDSCMSKGSIIVNVDAGDYIELYIVQNNLTGNVEYADIQMETLL